MLASLPMYERAETVAAHDALWTAVRDGLRTRGIAAPDQLTRAASPWDAWRSPELVLSQTCGLPYRTELHKLVALVGTPDYGLPETKAGHYFSVFVARADDTRDNPSSDTTAVMAVNDKRSQSGWAAPLDHLGPDFAPEATLMTGSHEGSARAVAGGVADWAALDAISWHDMDRSGLDVDALRVFARTRPTPGLPLITAGAHDPQPVAEAVAEALERISTSCRRDLGIRSLVRIPKADYLAVPVPQATSG